jgi:hypothetical protein
MSFNTTQPTLVAADDQRISFRAERRGSLPFKKRRLMQQQHGFGPVVVSQPSLVSAAYSASYKEQDDKAAAAALALLAAASGALTKMMPNSSATAAPPLAPLLALSPAAEAADRRTPPPSTSLLFSANPVVQPSTIHDSPAPAVGLSPVTPTSSEIHGGNQASSSSGPKPRVHHPPLSNPLPNGCHGRTSRNNSFCRRTPCYNASRYCKLHYQQYIVAGTRVPVGPTAVSESSSVTSTPTITHQDKRFTGCGDEVRCTATTTRGRACAYIAVTDGKYCHLHADYDTNPPPRRGGGGCSSAGSNKSRPSLLGSKSSSMNILPRMAGCPVIPDLGTSKAFSGVAAAAKLKPSTLPIDMGDAAMRQSPTSVSSDDSFHFPSKNINKANQALLSSISSDQWLNRKVVIAAGPLANRRGTVEKWGNGWVTVRVREGLTHNRRSVELYLMPEDSYSYSSSDVGPFSGDRQVIPHCVSYEKDAKQETAGLDGNEAAQCAEQS